jgi:hypothetical protein
MLTIKRGKCWVCYVSNERHWWKWRFELHVLVTSLIDITHLLVPKMALVGTGQEAVPQSPSWARTSRPQSAAISGNGNVGKGKLFFLKCLCPKFLHCWIQSALLAEHTTCAKKKLMQQLQLLKIMLQETAELVMK